MVKKGLIKGGSLIKGGTELQGSNVSILMVVIIILLSWVIYLLHDTYKNHQSVNNGSQRINITTNVKKENDLLLPPLKSDNSYYHRMISGLGGSGVSLPINIMTRGHTTEFSQIGILTKDDVGNNPLILPLMGRRVDRNKMQYYAISNTGSMNTRLPVKNKGRSCTDERGCDELFNGDEIFVEGYKTSFNTTIYENTNDFAYMV